MSPFVTLLELSMVEVVVTCGAIRCAKLQSNRHHQQTNTQLVTGRISFLSPNRQCQSTEGKICSLEHCFDSRRRKRRTKTVERREKSPAMLQPLVLAIANRTPTTRRLFLIATTSGRTIRHDTATAGRPTAKEKIGNRNAATSTEATTPVPRRNGGQSTIVMNIGTTVSAGEVERTNLIAARGTVTIAIAATVGGAETITDTVVATGTGATRNDIATTGRTPIPLRNVQRGAGRGHEKIQSHTQVETNLLAVDTGAEIGEFRSLLIFF